MFAYDIIIGSKEERGRRYGKRMGKRNPALPELRNENGGIQECGGICKGHMPEMRSEVRQLADQPEMRAVRYICAAGRRIYGR